MSSTKFWFLLLDSVTTGQPYEGSTADFVSLPPGSVVAEFRKLVHSKNSSILTVIALSQLLVYKNKAALDKRSASVDAGKEQPLKSSHNLESLGETEEEALIVVVPSPRIFSQITTDLCPRKEPNHNRKQRWIELNEIFDSSSKKPRANSSIADSSVTWSQVESVFAPSKYVQPQ